MAVKKLSSTQIEKKLLDISGWSVNKAETQLSKQFDFSSYLEGLSFIARVVVYAEVHQHYPEIELTHNKVKVKLTTQNAKGLTNIDFEIAKKLEKIAS